MLAKAPGVGEGALAISHKSFSHQSPGPRKTREVANDSTCRRGTEARVRERTRQGHTAGGWEPGIGPQSSGTPGYASDPAVPGLEWERHLSRHTAPVGEAGLDSGLLTPGRDSFHSLRWYGCMGRGCGWESG